MTEADSTDARPALLALAVDAAVDAGRLLARHAGAPATGLASKSSRTDLVSDADRASEDLIVGRLRAARPNDAIVAEEGSGDEGSGGEIRWLVDPLDGTINYLWSVPHWCVSIAAADSEGELVGVVHDPSRDETFTAVRGSGAQLNGRDLSLDAASDLAEALVGTGFNYRAEVRARQAERLLAVLPHVRDIRRLGAAALDLSWVAAGRIDAFFERGVAPWDTAAGALLVREAGGGTVDLAGDGQMPPGIVAARPGLTDAVLDLVEP